MTFKENKSQAQSALPADSYGVGYHRLLLELNIFHSFIGNKKKSVFGFFAYLNSYHNKYRYQDWLLPISFLPSRHQVEHCVICASITFDSVFKLFWIGILHVSSRWPFNWGYQTQIGISNLTSVLFGNLALKNLWVDSKLINSNNKVFIWNLINGNGTSFVNIDPDSDSSR